MKIKNVKHIEYFAKGHRGLLFTGIYKDKKVAIKIKNPKSEALGRMENEASFLKILNEKKIGPELYFYSRKDDYFVYEFIDGEFFPLFLEHAGSKKMVKQAIKSVFLQCYRMDKLRINKEEMHHPYKHIIVDRRSRKPVLIDFERCHYTEYPKNVSQFSSYIISDFIMSLLGQKGFRLSKDKIIAAAKRYKENMSKENLDKLVGLIR